LLPVFFFSPCFLLAVWRFQAVSWSLSHPRDLHFTASGHQARELQSVILLESRYSVLSRWTLDTGSASYMIRLLRPEACHSCPRNIPPC